MVFICCADGILQEVCNPLASVVQAVLHLTTSSSWENIEGLTIFIPPVKLIIHGEVLPVPCIHVTIIIPALGIEQACLPIHNLRLHSTHDAIPSIVLSMAGLDEAIDDIEGTMVPPALSMPFK